MARYDRKVFEYLENLKRHLETRPLNLGGAIGYSGGYGITGPPAGYIGYLPQTRVSYDYTEEASSGLAASGISLLDNLNHVRYRLENLEAVSGGGGAGHTITYSGVPFTQRTNLDFIGSVIVTDESGTDTTEIDIGAGGGGVGGWSPDPGVFYWDNPNDRFEFGDDVMMETSHRIYFYDTDAYIYTNDAYDLRIGAYQNIILELNDQLVIGTGAAGTDYSIKFDGETNDGLITWMEDEKYFSLNNDDVIIGYNELRIGATDPNWAYSSEINKTGQCSFGLRGYNTSVGNAPLLAFERSNSAVFGTKTTTVDNQIIGEIDVLGVHTGSNFDYGARITFVQDGAAGASSVPMEMIIELSPGDIGTTLYQVLKIGKEGDITIGGGLPNKNLILKFDGETNDGLITWFEDEDFFHFADDIMLANGQNLIFDTTTGTKIGTATNQKIGFFNAAPIVQPSEITDELTVITHTAPGTPDYAVQDLITISGYGFVTKDEGNTALSVITNLQARVNELENALSSLGLIADVD